MRLSRRIPIAALFCLALAPRAHADLASGNRATAAPRLDRITARGVGPFVLGMDAKEALAVAGYVARPMTRATEDSEEELIEVLARDGAPLLELRLDKRGGKVIAIDVVSPSVATEDGLRVGLRVADLQSRLGKPASADWAEGSFAVWASHPHLVFELSGTGTNWREILAERARVTAIRIASAKRRGG